MAARARARAIAIVAVSVSQSTRACRCELAPFLTPSYESVAGLERLSSTFSSKSPACQPPLATFTYVLLTRLLEQSQLMMNRISVAIPPYQSAMYVPEN